MGLARTRYNCTGSGVVTTLSLLTSLLSRKCDLRARARGNHTIRFSGCYEGTAIAARVSPVGAPCATTCVRAMTARLRDNQRKIQLKLSMYRPKWP